MPAEHDLLKTLGDAVVKTAAKRCVRALQRQRDLASGVDSGLTTTWDEYCVQVQEEESVFFAAYEEILENLAEHEVNQLSRTDLELAWLSTDDGLDWLDEEERDGPIAPYVQVVVDAVVAEVGYIAANWSSARITRYLDRSYDDRD